MLDAGCCGSRRPLHAIGRDNDVILRLGLGAGEVLVVGTLAKSNYRRLFSALMPI
jgi:hypothetical protein